MGLQHWPDYFKQRYGGEFPTTYCCWDLETTGFSFGKDLIIEIGHCLVRDLQVVDRLSLVIDWSGHPVVDEEWLRNRLIEVRDSMSKSGSVQHITYSRMKAEGVKPDKAFPFYLKFFNTLKENGTFLVTHNGYRFDEQMMNGNVAGFRYADEFSVGDDGMFDTMAIEKINLKWPDPKSMPRRGESMRDYFTRASYLRDTPASLHSACVPRYDLIKKYGVDVRESHKADYDAYLTHLLMKEYHALSLLPPPEPVRVARPVAATVPVREPSLWDEPDQPPTPVPVVYGDLARRRRQRNN